MLYSRPDIKPLNLDLEALPFREHMRSFHTKTTCGIPLYIRFSSGWLSVYKGEKGSLGATMGDALISQHKIAPFGVTGIMPEQICDVLGLTVQGKKIEGPDEEQSNKIMQSISGSGDFFDFSGRTIVWKSNHLMMVSKDADSFVGLIKNVFPDCVLYQTKSPGYKQKSHLRRIPFLLQSDDHVSFGIGAKEEAIESLFKQDFVDRPLYEDVFPFSFGFSRKSQQERGIAKYGKEIIEKHNAHKLGIRYGLLNIQEYAIGTEFQTSNDFAQECMSKLIGALDQYFHREFSAFDMQTGELLERSVVSGYDSYSGKIKDWCLEKPNNYIWVGYEDPSQRLYTSDGKPQYAKNGNPVFYGIRPAE